MCVCVCGTCMRVCKIVIVLFFCDFLLFFLQKRKNLKCKYNVIYINTKIKYATNNINQFFFRARSRILEQPDAKDRERYVVKFIKIMKHLRKINNFNSYLALLSALDSAPIRRLEWQKHITEGLKEYCALIDSSSSFRAYRQALADTQPPCIPYM